MQVKEYKGDNRCFWESFVQASNNGTIFSLQSFLDYHPAGRFDNRNLIFYDSQKPVAVMPAADAMREGKRILFSHPGASFGGIIAQKSLGISDAIKLVDALVKYASDHKYDAIMLTRAPWIYYEFPDDHIDFALFRAGAIYRKRELTAVLPLKNNFEENLGLFKSSARTSMRKAEKNGILVRESDDFAKFYEILSKNLSMRHNVAPTHTLDELLWLKKHFHEQIRLWSAFMKDEMIAGTIIFVCNPRVILAFYISQDYTHQSFRPLNLLFAKVIDWGISKKFRWLDFGTYTLNNIPNFGLARFKESLGARGIFRDTFFLPINRAVDGSICK